MRIGIEITPLTHTPTGVGYYVRHLLEALTQQLDADTLHGFASGIRPLDTDHIPIWYMRFPIPTRLLYQSWYYCGHPRVDTMLGGLDVYHAVNYVLPPVKRARRVLSIHDLSFIRFPEWSSPKIVAPFRHSIKAHAHAADVVIACSEATKKDIHTLLGVPKDRIRVVYDAADALFRVIAPEQAARSVYKRLGISPPYLLYVGTVEPRKNIVGLIEAFARADIPHRLLIVGGRGWNSDALPKLITRLGIEERVVFAGYMPDRSVLPALYSAADAFVFPSWYEGFGLPLIEAMACGCPVIASNSSSLPEVGGNAPYYIDPEDTDALKNAIETVTSDANLRQRMSEAGLVQSKRFSWNKCASDTMACYRSALKCV